ncbi:hypothetical protein [Pseudofrankia sp. DC12]|uniref:hypothetical protein n=1 Tax=Pseudofrankia sp. DC12 TaxID=683315 RepID=UPI001E2CA6C4|nr:hypothetical protein [Pseudofrankia sp. DC12]
MNVAAAVAAALGAALVGWLVAVGATVVSTGVGRDADDAGAAMSALIEGTATVGAELGPAEAAVALEARPTPVKVIPVPIVRTICRARLRRGLRMR